MIFMQAIWIFAIFYNLYMLTRSVQNEQHQDAKIFGLLQIFLILLYKGLF